MNSAASSNAPGFLSKSWSALNSALIVALLVAVCGWGFQYRETRLASKQTYNLERVAELSADGEKVDRAIVAFFNAAAEGKPVAVSRRTASQAIVDHSIKVESLRSVIGDRRADDYLAALNELDEQVAATMDARHAGPNKTAFGKVIETRRAVVNAVRASA